MKRCRVEIGTVRPHKSACLEIERHLIECRRILEGAEERSAKNRLEINALFGAVVERH
jgi:hypothetical protein